MQINKQYFYSAPGVVPADSYVLVLDLPEINNEKYCLITIISKTPDIKALVLVDHLWLHKNLDLIKLSEMNTNSWFPYGKVTDHAFNALQHLLKKHVAQLVVETFG